MTWATWHGRLVRRIRGGIKAPAKGTKMKYRVAVPSGRSYIAGYGAWLTITGT
jgi:hypothetical protein